jgi:hypothetical protein
MPRIWTSLLVFLGVVCRASSYEHQLVSWGDRISCAVVGDGDLMCWGPGWSQGEWPESQYPIKTDIGTRSVLAVEVGDRYGCVLCTDGAVLCWGINDYSPFKPFNDLKPSKIPIEAKAVQITSAQPSGFHVCIVVEHGDVYCVSRDVSVLQLVQIDNCFAMHIQSEGDTTHILCSDGRLYQDFTTHNLGHHESEYRKPVLLAIGGTTPGLTIQSGSFGDTHKCAIYSDAQLRCWGDNRFGAVGTGNTNISSIDSPTEIQLVDGKTATSVSVTGHSTCAILSDQSVQCWGQFNQEVVASPKKINTLTNVLRLASAPVIGGDAFCALSDTERLWCWGDNPTIFGLGVCDTQSRYISVPTLLDTLSECGSTESGLNKDSRSVSIRVNSNSTGWVQTQWITNPKRIYGFFGEFRESGLEQTTIIFEARFHPEERSVEAELLSVAFKPPLEKNTNKMLFMRWSVGDFHTWYPLNSTDYYLTPLMAECSGKPDFVFAYTTRTPLSTDRPNTPDRPNTLPARDLAPKFSYQGWIVFFAFTALFLPVVSLLVNVFVDP